MWQPFFQQEQLTTRIHNILRDYPPGIGIFKEFIQNADDARAKDFAIIIDNSTGGKASLISPGLGEWQGPSIFIYNSGVFTDKDFQGITQVGQSVKYTDTSTIGKYGLGFNCSYHFTDVVSFVSNDQLIIFDPHGSSLPDRVLGLRTNFLTGTDIWSYHGMNFNLLKNSYLFFSNFSLFSILISCFLDDRSTGTIYFSRS